MGAVIYHAIKFEIEWYACVTRCPFGEKHPKKTLGAKGVRRVGSMGCEKCKFHIGCFEKFTICSHPPKEKRAKRP